jgi:hypothetical protein
MDELKTFWTNAMLTRSSYSCSEKSGMINGLTEIGSFNLVGKPKPKYGTRCSHDVMRLYSALRILSGLELSNIPDHFLQKRK